MSDYPSGGVYPPRDGVPGEEHYWCGCIRFAHWDRCDMHTTLDHDEEPPRQRPTESAVVPAPDTREREQHLLEATVDWENLYSDVLHKNIALRERVRVLEEALRKVNDLLPTFYGAPKEIVRAALTNSQQSTEGAQ